MQQKRSQDLSIHMEAVARRLLGEPNKSLSKPTEIRYGTHGSLAIDLKKGVWFDNESKQGGGVLDLIRRERGFQVQEALQWMQEEIGLPDERQSQQFIVETYDYRDQENQLVFQVVRYHPKTFRQRRRERGGAWVWNVKGIEPVPYRLPELLDAPTNDVFVVEGEKDVDRLQRLGLTATCNAGGAGKWHDLLSEHLRGRRVFILADNDAPGRDHAQLVASSVYGKAAEVRIVHLPNLPEKGDVSHWLENGGSVEALQEIAAGTALWSPTTAPSPLGTILWENAGTIPAAEWFVKGLLGNGGMSVVYGEPGTGKSFLALDIAAHVGFGDAWFGRKVEGGPVAYVAAEGGQGVRKRIAALQQEKFTDQRECKFALIPRSLDLLSEEGDLDELLAELERVSGHYAEPFKLIVIDTLSRVMAGGNENYPDDMGRLIMNVDRIRSATSAHVMLIHHTAKDPSLGMRGHGSLRGATDTAILLEKDEVNAAISIRVNKQKDGEEGDLATMVLQSIELGSDQDGDVVSSCIVNLTGPQGQGDTRRKRKPNENGQIGLMALEQALAKTGQTTPNHLPDDFRRYVPSVVPVSAWRECFYSRKGEKRDNPDTLRKSFQRASDNLQATGIIRVHDEWVGLIK